MGSAVAVIVQAALFTACRRESLILETGKFIAAKRK